MSEAPATYHVIQDGQPLLVLFDEHAEVGDDAHPMCVTLSFPLEGVGSRGLPDAEESAFLMHFERQLCAQAPAALDLQWVGRRTGLGRADFCFYAAEAPHLEDQIHVLLARWPDRIIAVRVLHDAEWELFQKAFIPGPDERLSLDNLARIEDLAERGCEIDQPHRVTHRASFATAESADAFRAVLKGEGLASHLHLADETRTVSAVLEHDLLLGSVELATKRLAMKARDAGGEYAGWSLA